MEFNSLYKKGTVKRLNNFCCQFEPNKIYEAMISDSYTHVKWDDGEWSSGHWAPYHVDNPSFEIIEIKDSIVQE